MDTPVDTKVKHYIKTKIVRTVLYISDSSDDDS